jgi:probable FeS assembly SUF system protein SufT
MPNSERTLSRDVTATQIPSGDKTPLPAGTRITISQTLGGNFTVTTDFGLFRIDAKDGDALGEAVAETTVTANTLANGAPDPAAVWDQLRKVYDPEIPVNIVDLGLIYGCEVAASEGGSRVRVQMTLTAPGCGMGPVIAREAEEKISGLPGVASASVEVVWEPPWSPDRISAEGREKLGME